jgi:hypothetical protein
VEEKNKRTSPLKRGMISTVFVTAVEVTHMGRGDDDGNDEDDVLRCHRRCCSRRAVYAPLSLVVTMDNDKAVEREEKADDTAIRIVVAVDRSVVAAKPKYDIFSFIVYRTTDRPYVFTSPQC